MWIEDGIQDVRVALWLHQTTLDVLLIRSASIDAARKYGPHSRRGVDRRHCDLDGLAIAAPVTTETSERLIDVGVELRKLSPHHQRALRDAIAGRRQPEAMRVEAYRVKKKLRRLCA